MTSTNDREDRANFACDMLQFLNAETCGESPSAGLAISASGSGINNILSLIMHGSVPTTGLHRAESMFSPSTAPGIQGCWPAPAQLGMPPGRNPKKITCSRRGSNPRPVADSKIIRPPL